MRGADHQARRLVERGIECHRQHQPRPQRQPLHRGRHAVRAHLGVHCRRMPTVHTCMLSHRPWPRTSPKPSPASPVTRSATCRPMRVGNIVGGGVGLDVEVVDRGHRHQRSRSAPASSRAKHAAHIQWSAMMPPLTDHDLAVVLPRLCAGGPQSAAPAARFLDDARAKRLPDTLPDGCRPRVAVVPTALRVRVRDEIGGLQES